MKYELNVRHFIRSIEDTPLFPVSVNKHLSFLFSENMSVNIEICDTELVNFEICDTELVSLVEKSEYISSQESNDWEDIGPSDEIEDWVKKEETKEQSLQKTELEQNVPEKNNNECPNPITEIEQEVPMECDEDTRQDMLDFVKKQQSENTILKTQSDMKRFNKFLRKKGEKRKIIDIPPLTLDGYIGHFIMALERQDGSPYEPGTITGFHR